MDRHGLIIEYLWYHIYKIVNILIFMNNWLNKIRIKKRRNKKKKFDNK
jgi:hypothetical protein